MESQSCHAHSSNSLAHTNSLSGIQRSHLISRPSAASKQPHRGSGMATDRSADRVGSELTALNLGQTRMRHTKGDQQRERYHGLRRCEQEWVSVFAACTVLRRYSALCSCIFTRTHTHIHTHTHTHTYTLRKVF